MLTDNGVKTTAPYTNTKTVIVPTGIVAALIADFSLVSQAKVSNVWRRA